MMALEHRSTVLLVSIFVLICFTQRISAQKTSGWKTLSGKAPLVIARGGLSGLFPDQTLAAYNAALNNSLNDAVMYCDLQLSKDGFGICRSDLRLENSTTIASVIPKQENTYVVNGNNISGYFSIDYTADFLLANISAIQSFGSRPVTFDNAYSLVQPEGLTQLAPITIWLNVQYPTFFEKHKLSMSSSVISISKSIVLSYISSSEVGFLQSIAPKFRRTKTKLILMLLGKEDVDPSTNETYGALVKNLTFVKTFAAGIMVPKDYILPVGTDLYLQVPTSLVQDAHSAGLEIFASGFANDEYGMSYNYSYDPIREYLQFVDNKNFAVDGILTDFSVTASEAIACYAQNNASTSSKEGKPLIISHNGASGDYPGCTDVAYQAAIRDGADYIDCSVQITKDGVPICRESPDLTTGTNILSNSVYYPSYLKQVQGINKMVLDQANTDPGIFTFDLTWKEIQSLKPNIYSPFDVSGYSMKRNPAEFAAGKYMNLSAFLEFAQSQGNIGVVINIENARTIALARNLSILEPTISALNMSGYNNMTNRILIQSSESAVLMEFKQRTKFKLVYVAEENAINIPDSTIKEINTFSDAVVISRTTVYPPSGPFLVEVTDIVQRVHRYNMSVFIYLLRNEFTSLAFDYLADPTMEIRSLLTLAKVDGLITDFPATARAYLGNACLGPTTGTAYPMYLASPGSIELAIPPDAQPPALAPSPLLASVAESPLPSVTEASAPAPTSLSTNVPAAPSPSKPSNACHSRQSLSVSLLIGLFILFLYYN